MGNSTTHPTSTRRLFDAADEVADRLDATRVELYRLDGDTAHLEASSGGPGSPHLRVPLAWFPWSLGNIRPERYVFIRNADALPTGPSSPLTLGDVGFRSALHVPVSDDRGRAIGALAAYWSVERAAWDSSLRSSICSTAAEVLTHRN